MYTAVATSAAEANDLELLEHEFYRQDAFRCPANSVKVLKGKINYCIDSKKSMEIFCTCRALTLFLGIRKGIWPVKVLPQQLPKVYVRGLA